MSHDLFFSLDYTFLQALIPAFIRIIAYGVLLARLSLKWQDVNSKFGVEDDEIEEIARETRCFQIVSSKEEE